MTLFEVDDFDVWVEVGVAQDSDLESFCAMFFYLIDWAVCNKFLSDELKLCQVFQEKYAKVCNERISFSEFVDKALDGKLLTSFFSSDVQKFLEDYVRLDGYSGDLTRHFKVNIWELPSTVKASREFGKVINISLNNYKRNFLKNPNIVSFSDPPE